MQRKLVRTFRAWAAIAVIGSFTVVSAAIRSHEADAQQEQLTCFGRKPTITGTDTMDTLRGTPEEDIIAGLGGADEIFGLDDDDFICGGDGGDDIDAGPGLDNVDGGEGQDTCGQPEPNEIFRNCEEGEATDGLAP